MALNSLPALQVQAPQVNGAANYMQANAAAHQSRDAEFQHKQQVVQAMAVMGLSALNGNIDGTPDPKVWEQVLDHAEQSGMDPTAIADLRGKPQMAQVLARGSLDVLKYAQDKQAFDLQLQKLGMEIEQAKTQGPLDAEYKRAQIDALNAKPAVTPTDDQRELDQINTERAAAGKPPVAMEDYLKSKQTASGSTVTLPDGTVVTTGPKMTEGQGKSTGFYIRGKGANDSLAANEKQLTDLVQQGTNAIPIAGNFWTSKEFKAANRDAAEFLAVILRKDTGAAVTPKEFELYGPMYLPAPGDDEDTLALKRAARDRALEAVRADVGPGEIILKEREAQDAAKSGGAPPASGAPAQPGEPVDWTTYF